MFDWKRFRSWCYYYMTEHMKCPFSDMHDEWFSLMGSQRVALAAPRSFAKSFIFSLFYPLYCACEGVKKDVLLVSATGTLAEWFLIKVRSELENNLSLRSDYGDLVGGVWRNDHIQLKNGVVMRAKGAGYQIRGFRPDLVIVDDVETDEAVWSEDQRNKFDDWFWRALVGTLDHSSQLIVVGTLLHPLSFLSILLKGRDGWATKTYRALDKGKSVWEERWPTLELERRRDEIGAPAFEQEYMNNPIPSEWRIFKPDYIQYWQELPQGVNYFTTVDPARTAKRTSDYTAIVTCAVDSKKNLYVVDYTRDRMQPSDVVKEIFRHYQKYEPECVGIEYVGLEDWLKLHLEDYSAKHRVYPNFRGLKLDISEKGQKKRYRIEMLQPYFEKGQIWLRRDMDELVGEILSFPTGQHDDCIDALASVLEIWHPGEELKEKLPDDCFKSYWDKKKRFNRRLRGRYGRRSNQ